MRIPERATGGETIGARGEGEDEKKLDMREASLDKMNQELDLNLNFREGDRVGGSQFSLKNRGALQVQGRCRRGEKEEKKRDYSYELWGWGRQITGWGKVFGIDQGRGNDIGKDLCRERGQLRLISAAAVEFSEKNTKKRGHNERPEKGTQKRKYVARPLNWEVRVARVCKERKEGRRYEPKVKWKRKTKIDN